MVSLKQVVQCTTLQISCGKCSLRFASIGVHVPARAIYKPMVMLNAQVNQNGHGLIFSYSALCACSCQNPAIPEILDPQRIVDTEFQDSLSIPACNREALIVDLECILYAMY